MTSPLCAPAPDELEISVFGKGIGECCVVHVGCGRWIVIDSLLDDNGIPVAVSYLEHIGVPSEAIDLVALTHWHDDHIKGAAELIRLSPNALVSYAAVLRQDEFQAAVRRVAPTDGTKFGSGVRELLAISKLLMDRPQHRKVAMADRTIFQNSSMEIKALSPSDEDFRIFLDDISKWHDRTDIAQVISVPNRNDISVVLVFIFDEDMLLFGADLEVRNELSGWQCVHENYWNDRGRCSFYKVAHHGSETGHYEPKWTDMLSENVTAVLTPYGRGRKKLPSAEDIERIISKTSSAYTAGDSTVFRARRQNNTVERTLSEASIKLERPSNRLGHVRMRRKFEESHWVPLLVGQAFQLA